MEVSTQDINYFNKLTVLYVEDDRIHRNKFEQYLLSFTKKLLIANDGVQGLKAFIDHRPDIVLTDMIMPNMDGLAMARGIRNIDRKVPIILMTATDQADYLFSSINIGIDQFLTKPVNECQLHESLRKCSLRLLAEENSLQLATTKERVRLAHDLHDGLLQSLTAAALQLETARRLIEINPAEAIRHLSETQSIIIAEQRALRSHIQYLKPLSAREPQIGPELSANLDELASRIKRNWSLHVEMCYRNIHSIPQNLTREIYLLVHESLINAANHAHASSVCAIIGVNNDNLLEISIRDNGKGFPFRGSYDLLALNHINAGPYTLKERTSHLGGSLVIDSNESGSHLKFTIPLTE